MNTKSRGHCWRLRLGGAVSNACRKTSFPPCHWAHHHRHARHDASSRHGKKEAFGRSKSPADAGKKIADCGSPSPALPKGRESILAVFYAVGWNSLPLGRVGEGPLYHGNSVGVALSRRRYPRQDDGLLFFDGYYQIEYNAFG